MNNASRALMIAAGLFLTIALITLVVNLFGSAQEASKQAQNDFSSMQTELASQSFAGYDNTTLTGSQVLNAIRKFNGTASFGIQVVTGRNTSAGQTGAWYGNTVDTTAAVDSANYGTTTAGGTGLMANAQDENHTDYINPSGQFRGQVIRDHNNVVRGIVFTQQ